MLQEIRFAIPVYGGNRNMVAWRMIGFPGAYASYYDLVDQHGVKIDRPPMSLAADAHGDVHVDPGIRAIPRGLPLFAALQPLRLYRADLQHLDAHQPNRLFALPVDSRFSSSA
jgi:hypothetical protein